MRTYLESTLLQRLVAAFAASDKPWGAICHGVVLAARSSAPDARSVLHGRRTTALLASQELLAWSLTALWMGSYYRTYPETVEAEVRRRLREGADFVRGPLPLARDRAERLSHGFALRDGNYLSARWPGDAHRFATTYCAMLDER
jgi:protease I